MIKERILRIKQFIALNYRFAELHAVEEARLSLIRRRNPLLPEDYLLFLELVGEGSLKQSPGSEDSIEVRAPDVELGDGYLEVPEGHDWVQVVWSDLTHYGYASRGDGCVFVDAFAMPIPKKCSTFLELIED